MLVIWKDVTEEKKIKAAKELEQIALEEQKLSNLFKANELSSALKLALKLKRPFQVLKIVESKYYQCKHLHIIYLYLYKRIYVE